MKRIIFSMLLVAAMVRGIVVHQPAAYAEPGPGSLPTCKNIPPDAPPATLVTNAAEESVPARNAALLGAWDGLPGSNARDAAYAIVVQTVSPDQIVLWHFHAAAENVVATSTWRMYTYNLTDGLATYGDHGKLYIDKDGHLVDETNSKGKGSFTVENINLETMTITFKVVDQLVYKYSRCALP